MANRHAMIVNCFLIAVRKEPNPESELVCELPSSTNLVIDDQETSGKFYKICTPAGIEGYCLKKFIRVLS